VNRLATNLSGWQLENPVIAASGTFGFGHEFASWYDINVLGSISLKGTTKKPRFGNQTPRIAECRQGMLNAIGLQNPGVGVVISTEIPKLRETFKKKIIANVAGATVEEYLQVAECFDQVAEVALLEINLSCPNVKEGGLAFGSSAESVANICKELKKTVKKPVYIKLSPNVTDIVEIATAAEAAGADGLVLANTLLGMVVDTSSGKPIVSCGIAGFSGPAIKPVALAIVYRVFPKVKIPIIGVGGIANAADVIEFMSVGATAVQVGTQNLIDPLACHNIITELPAKMDQYGIEKLSDIVGRSHRC
jgi:dihydroorotate dehydrogenase (NAD+) catalytic subunit